MGSQGPTRRGQPEIEALIAPDPVVHVFWREEDRAPFTYAGLGEATAIEDTSPVRLKWEFSGRAEPAPREAQLVLARTVNDIRAAIREFNRGASDHQERGRSLMRSTSFWVSPRASRRCQKACAHVIVRVLRRAGP